MDIFPTIVCLVIFFLICLFRLDLGLAVLAMLLPTYVVRFKVGFLPMTFLEGCIIAIFLVWLIKNIQKKSLISNVQCLISNLKRLKLFIPIILFLLAATISVFVSPDLRSAAGIWKAYFIEPLLLFLVFISIIKIKRQIRLILYGLGISAIWVSIIAIYQKFTGFAIPDPLWQAEASRRVTSIYGYPNALGLYLGPIIVLYFGLLRSKFQSVLATCYLLLVTFLSLLAIVFARSQGAWMGVLAGILFLGLLTQKRKWFLLALIVLVLLFSLPQTRIKILDWAGYEKNIGVRLDLWKDSLRLIKHSPLFGTGLAGFQSTYEKYREVKHFGLFPYPHNIILNFWTETGLLGLIAFVWLIIRFFKTGLRKLQVITLRVTSRRLASYPFDKLRAGKLQVTSLMSAMICIIIHGLVDVPYFKNDLSILFWMFIGLMLIIEKLKIKI